MSEINYNEGINTKSMMLDYLRISGKENMAEAVELYCNDENGIVFNKHPAVDENKFSNIYDYTSRVKTSVKSNYSEASVYTEHLSKEFLKNFKMISSSIESNDEDKEKEISLKTNDNKTVLCKQQKQESTNEINNNVEKTTNILTKNPSSKNTDHLYDILAPEGKGKFQKFIGEDFIYVLLEDGTHNCYPIDLVKYNPAYIKANPLYSMNKNYNDIALQHTRNILKAKENNLCKLETNHNKQNKLPDEFLNFPEATNYMKKYLQLDTAERETFQKNYIIHLQTKNQISQNLKNDASEQYIQDPTCNPIKKNIQVTSMNNIYQIQRIEPYKIVEEEITNEDELCEACC